MMVERLRWIFYCILSFVWRLFHWRRHKRMLAYFKFLEDVGRLTIPADWRR